MLKKKVQATGRYEVSFHGYPTPMASELGIEPATQIEVTSADKRKKPVDLGFAYIKVKDREAIAHVLIMETPEPIIGTFTLQLLGLAVDPVTEEVKPARSFAIGLL